MKIALPVENGKLCMHFGHCGAFQIFDVDKTAKKINSTTKVDAPPHQPGLLPVWLSEKGVNCVIAGGMGARAVGLFNDRNIEVLTGTPMDPPEKIVSDYLNGKLVTGDNVCDH